MMRLKMQPTHVFFNREMSWLEFNRRVLAEGLDLRNPLLSRVGFINIFFSNLDEFFMKRVGGLKRQVLAKVHTPGAVVQSPQEQLNEIRKVVIPLLDLHSQEFKKQILKNLEKEGIQLLKYASLSETEKTFADEYFNKEVFPVLTPLAVDPGHPFPFISNLSVSFGVLLRHPNRPTEELFARIKVPSLFPTWVKLPTSDGNANRFVSLYEVIGEHLNKLFSGMELIDMMMFRITRNADIERDAEDAEDLLSMVAEELKERRFARVVRLEHGPKPNSKILQVLMEELSLEPDDVYELPLWLEYYQLKTIAELNRPELKFEPFSPVTPPVFADPDANLFDIIRSQDVLVHHPYESFTNTVERFLRTAADDKRVLAIKMTLYRTGEDSPFIPILIRAAESGKQVAVLVELQARFDEERNIRVAQMLEKSGVHVVYGILGFKTHCKLALVVRQDADAVRSYAHIGTGNYHSVTARLYTDLGLFTANHEITNDVVHLFHYLTGRSLTSHFQRLLVAPIDMKESFIRMIERESSGAKAQGHIVVKLNNLQDPEIIEALYTASQKGVRVDLIVRGICCLKPNVKGISENIRVVSQIGRFLEHSRVYYFRNGAATPEEGEVFLGSADWMTRNLSDRVEAVVPIHDPVCKARVWEILSLALTDIRQTWQLSSDGSYHSLGNGKVPNAEGFQEKLLKAVFVSAQTKR